MAFKIAYWLMDEAWYIPKECQDQYLYMYPSLCDSNDLYEIQKWAETEAIDDIIVCYSQEASIDPYDLKQTTIQKMMPSISLKIIAIDKRDLMVLKLKFKNAGNIS